MALHAKHFRRIHTDIKAANPHRHRPTAQQRRAALDTTSAADPHGSRRGVQLSVLQQHRVRLVHSAVRRLVGYGPFEELICGHKIVAFPFQHSPSLENEGVAWRHLKR